MATIDLGKIRFNWQGAYNNSTAYVVNDVVSSGGNSYICKLASTGNAVSNGTYWDLMSQAGTNGTNGTDVGTVITTQGDVLYRDGSGLQKLGAGTSGQFLKTQGTGANPVWADPGGGAWNFISSQVQGSASTTLSLIDCFTTTYDYYVLRVAMKRAGSYGEPCMHFSDDSGSTWETGLFRQLGWRADANGNVLATGQGGRNPIELMTGADVPSGGWLLVNVYINIGDFDSAGNIEYRVEGGSVHSFNNSSAHGYNLNSRGNSRTHSVRPDSFRLYFNNTSNHTPETNCIASGSSVYCYGMANS